jgi:hypothetical protein
MSGGLALWGSVGSRPELRPLLVEVSRQCPVTAFDPADPPHAVLVDASVELPAEVAAPRLVRWTDTAEGAALGVEDGRVAAVLSTDVGAARSAGALGIVVPTVEALAGDIRPVWPHVRARLTATRGLPPHAVADCTGGRITWDGEVVDDTSTDTVLAASAVVVTDEPALLLRALAWAAPCVATPGAATELGVADDVEVVVGEADQLHDMAGALARDVHRTARLSLAGRRWYEQTADVGWAATRLVERIGYVRPGVQHLDQLHAQLGTSTTAASYRRAAARIGSLDIPVEV